MKEEQLYDVWWQERTEGEQRMEEEHLRHWEKVVHLVMERNLEEYSILDFGCNQGGFLRYLYAKMPFREGIGTDLARYSIAVANERKGNAPLQYVATGEPEQFPGRFDLAFSISVIYLIADLKEHAWKMKQALKPGGVYYATYTDYSRNPSLPHIQAKINEHGSLPMNLHSLDGIAREFIQAGFQVGIQRMSPQGFIGISPGERWFLRAEDRIQYEYEEAYIFRFTAPAQ